MNAIVKTAISQNLHREISTLWPIDIFENGGLVLRDYHLFESLLCALTLRQWAVYFQVFYGSKVLSPNVMLLLAYLGICIFMGRPLFALCIKIILG